MSEPPATPEGLIAYTKTLAADNREIWLVSADGTGATKFPTEGSEGQKNWGPSLSFDQKSIAWSMPAGIRVGDVADQTSFDFTHHKTMDYNPAWAPDGSVIALVSTRKGTSGVGPSEVYLRTAQEGADDLTPLTSNDIDDYEPSWDTDSKRLVFTRGLKAAAQLVVIDVATKAEDPLTDNHVAGLDPAWSPDGTRIAFARLVDGHYDLFIWKIDDNSVTPLTTTPDVDEHDPAWSPDSEFLVYTTGGPLHIINVSDGADSALALPGNLGWPSWR